MKILETLLDGALKGKTRRIAVPVANHAEILGCIARASELKIASFAIIGDPDETKAAADACGANISSADIIPETDPVRACEKAAQMASSGDADVLMKGQVQTADFMRAALNKSLGLIPSGGLLSHVGVFEFDGYHKPLILSDAGINIAPDIDQKARILLNAIRLASAIGILKPKVACIAAVEKVSPKMQSAVDADAMKSRGKTGEFGGAIVSGPMGFDLAVSKAAAATKEYTDPVAGDADIILAPGIDAGNALYKCLTMLVKAQNAAIVMGANVPVVMTSRADSEDAKLYSIALAAKAAG